MDADVMEEIFLKAWRIYAGLTQEELGARMGITGTQISRIESGKRDYDGRFLRAFREAINTKLDSYDMPEMKGMWRITHVADALCVNPDPATWVRLTSALERNAQRLAASDILPQRLK